MVAEMTPFDRAIASLNDDPVDQLTAYPIACGVLRRLLPDHPTYREWASDPKICASAFIEGFNRYKFPFTVTLLDLSVMAADLGAHVRMDTENTPFVDKHIVETPEDYEKLEVPDITKGRSNVLIETNRIVGKELKGKSAIAAFLEGPLLVLSQSVGAEKLLMDMYTDPAPVHKALEVTTQYAVDITNALGETGVDAMCWDYLWANYSVLGDKEYHEFEADKYAKATNDATRDNGLVLGVHSCADLPHLDTQINEFGSALYSMAYYPLIPGSLSASEVIDKGYADNCLIAGNIDPQTFVRGTPEKVTEITKGLCQEVKTALCRRGLNSRYCIASGCEVPPSLETNLGNISAVMNTVGEYGRFD